jgi:uncharacterized protein (TIGR02118 family)
MIKVGVMYPCQAGARFDMDYYRDRHMPMLKALMGEACLYYTVDRGITGARPGSPPVYAAMCHIHCESAEAFNTAFGPHVKAIMADVPNYTDLQPVLQVSEIVVEH